jgi:hypothetical protein
MSYCKNMAGNNHYRGKRDHSSNPPMVLIPSTNRRYSRNSSPTSETLISSSEHSKNRETGGARRKFDGDSCPDTGGIWNDIGRDKGCFGAEGVPYTWWRYTEHPAMSSDNKLTLKASCGFDSPGMLARRSERLFLALLALLALFFIMLSKL